MSDRLAMIKGFLDRRSGWPPSPENIQWLVNQVEGLRLELDYVNGQLTGVIRDYRELRATLVDLTEEWSSTGGGVANSPYDVGVLDTYTAVVRRIRQVLADPGNAIEQGGEGTS